MEKKSKEKNEIFLPTSLMDDIEFDELDKELEFTPVSEENNSTNKSKHILYFNFFAFNLVTKNLNDVSFIPNEKMLINNNNFTYSDENWNNTKQFSNPQENLFHNFTNSNEIDFPQNITENNDNLNFNLNSNFFNNKNFNSINKPNNKYETFDIIYLLKNNPDIYSYIHIFDYLTCDDLLKMFSFILKNIIVFISNGQSYLIINKIISLYNSIPPNFNETTNNNNENDFNESIFSFLFAFFSKRLLYLINSNNYLTTVVNLVNKLGCPKNDFVFNDIKAEFKKYANNRQGCLLIQNLFPLGNDTQRQNLLKEILDKYNELIVDRYGHYIFKYLLYKAENGEKYYSLIFNKIVNNIKAYTSNKYSSVVIERLLDSSNEYIKNVIIKKLCKTENDIVELIYHSYGNYVLQKIISVTKDNQILGLIYKTVMKNKNSMYKLSYGKKIMKEISVAYTLK